MGGCSRGESGQWVGACYSGGWLLSGRGKAGNSTSCDGRWLSLLHHHWVSGRTARESRICELKTKHSQHAQHGLQHAPWGS